jgi:hypothetical protein
MPTVSSNVRFQRVRPRQSFGNERHNKPNARGRDEKGEDEVGYDHPSCLNSNDLLNSLVNGLPTLQVRAVEPKLRAFIDHMKSRSGGTN